MWETLLAEAKNILGPAISEADRVGLWPAVATSAVLVLATVVGRGRVRAALLPVAVAAGLVTSLLLFSSGKILFPPPSTTAWLPFIAAGAALVMAIAGAAKWERIGQVLGVLAGAAAVYYAGAFAGPSKAQLATVGVPAVLLIGALVIAAPVVEDRIHRLLPWMVWPMVLGGTSIALTYAASSLIAMACAAGATVATMILVGGALQRDESLVMPSVVLSVQFVAMWTNALLFSKLGTTAALALAGAALAPFAASFVPASPRVRGLLALVLAGGLVGAAVLVVYFAQAKSGYGGY